MTDDSLDEDWDTGPDELLDWICLQAAWDGERFYPPQETAEECVETIDIKAEYNQGKEHGYHNRAWLDALELFEALERKGYDPQGRARRELGRLNDTRDDDVDELIVDWEWWTEHRRHTGDHQ